VESIEWTGEMVLKPHSLIAVKFLWKSKQGTHQGPRYWWIDPPTDAEIKDIAATLAKRVIRFLKKKGYFTPAACSQDEVDVAVPDEEISQEELLPEFQAASVQSKIATGERKGQRVRRLGVPEYGEFTRAACTGDFQAELKGSLSAVAAGFRCTPMCTVPHGRGVNLRNYVAILPGPQWPKSGSR